MTIPTVTPASARKPTPQPTQEPTQMSTQPPTPLLSVRNLSVGFEGQRGRVVPAVRDLSFTLEQGRSLALVGESGCGKSSTALALLRLVGPGSTVTGSIRFDGRDILTLSEPELRRVRGRDIAMIFQEPMTSLNPVRSIGDQIGETLRLHEQLSGKAARQRTLELLDLVRIAEPQRRIDDYPHNLSGGQRQRAMIAMAVACRPRLLVADEPTTALDVTIQSQIFDLLDGLRREFDMALLLITHDLGVVSRWADRVVVMYGGEKVEEGDTGRLFAAPSHPYTRGLLGASLHGGAASHYSTGRLPEIDVRIDPATRQRSFNLIVSEAGVNRRPAPATEESPLLSVHHLTTEYATRNGVFRAVDDVSFDIAAGETVGLVGESGCGKSTLSRTLMSLVPALAGRIRLDGTDLIGLDDRALKPWRKRMQMVFQDPYGSLNPRRTVQEILDSVLLVSGVRSRHDRRQQIATILDRVGLPAGTAARYPNEFSGGQRQRIGIARALILKPSLIICDEPVSALDVSIQAQILNLLVELRRDFNLSYLFISHDLGVVRYIADRVLVMQAGKIVESGTHRQIWERPQHPYTRRLLDAAPIPAQREAA